MHGIRNSHSIRSGFFKTIFTLVCILPLISHAQVADVSSPQASVINHLENLQEETYHPERSIESFRWTEKNRSEKEKKQLAIKLKQIYDGLGAYIDVELIPDEKNYVDSLTGRSRYYVLDDQRDIYLEKYGDKWLYSKKTISKINEIHWSVFPMGASFFMQFIPPDQGDKYLGLHKWQWAGTGILLVFLFILFFVIRYVIGNLLAKGIDMIGTQHFAPRVLHSVSTPASIFTILTLFRIFYTSLLFPVRVNYILGLGLKIFIPVFAVYIIYKLVDLLGIYLYKLAERTESKLDDQLMPLIIKTLRVFVIIIGLIFILQNLNFNVMGLVAGLSIGGLALALAAQDTVKNFLGSIMIFADKPFQIGDWITGDGFDGVVEEVGFRSTRVRSFTNSLMYVPNGKVADMITDNHGRRKYRRFTTRIGITYDTRPNVINKFVQGLRKIVDNHPDTVKDNYHIYLNDFGASSLEILFYIFFEVPQWGDELKSRHEIIVKVIELAEALEVRFAFPTQTIHIEEIPGSTSLTPIHKLSDEEMEAKINEVIGKNKN